MSDLKFNTIKVYPPRRAEIKALLDAQAIEILSPKTDMSDEDNILQKCRAISTQIGVSVDELASYFYSLAFEAEPVQKSDLDEFIQEFYRRVYTEPRSVIHKSSL